MENFLFRICLDTALDETEDWRLERLYYLWNALNYCYGTSQLFLCYLRFNMETERFDLLLPGALTLENSVEDIYSSARITAMLSPGLTYDGLLRALEQCFEGVLAD